MTEQQQAAMRQALEALTPDPELAFWYVEKLKEQAITALRQALEQQPNQSPHAEYDRGFNNGWDACAAHKQQPAGEPVARVAGYHSGFPVIEPLNPRMVLPINMALYTRPQPAAWVGLTNEEYEAIAAETLFPVEYGRAIEAKLREKNGGKA